MKNCWNAWWKTVEMLFYPMKASICSKHLFLKMMHSYGFPNNTVTLKYYFLWKIYHKKLFLVMVLIQKMNNQSYWTENLIKHKDVWLLQWRWLTFFEMIQIKPPNAPRSDIFISVGACSEKTDIVKLIIPGCSNWKTTWTYYIKTIFRTVFYFNPSTLRAIFECKYGK